MTDTPSPEPEHIPAPRVGEASLESRDVRPAASGLPEDDQQTDASEGGSEAGVSAGGPEASVSADGPEAGVSANGSEADASVSGPETVPSEGGRETGGSSGEDPGTPVTSGAGPQAAEPSLSAGLEAILLVVDEPVPEVTLAQILERPRQEIAAALRELAAEYTAQGRGFDLREIAGGWRFYTRETCAPVVERFVRDGQQARLTQAALETLAVVAYRQPVSRARVSAIRGVNSDGVIRTLTLRGLIEEAGHDPEHQAVLYRTTGYFLERLGLNSLDELPDLAPYLPDDVEGIEELQQ